MRMRTIIGPLLAVGAVVIARRRSRTDVDLWVDDTVSPPTRGREPVEVPVVRRAGSRANRGAGGSVRMDLEQAAAHHLEPVVEYLTYIQNRRGDRAHLLFVRTDDLDQMAASADEPADEFLSRLDQLGVVVSHN
jgi:hypothetical protein